MSSINYAFKTLFDKEEAITLNVLFTDSMEM